MSGGDGLGLLALLMLGAVLLIFGVMVSLGWLLGWGVARMVGAPPRTQRRAGGITALMGMAGGAVIVAAVFYADAWSPPIMLDVHTPRGFSQPSVMLLENPRLPNGLAFQGIAIPFVQRRAIINVPANGVVYVNDLSPLTVDVGYTLGRVTAAGDGQTAVPATVLVLPPPEGSHARRFVYIVPQGAADDVQIGMDHPRQSGAMLRARTGGTL